MSSNTPSTSLSPETVLAMQRLNDLSSLSDKYRLQARMIAILTDYYDKEPVKTAPGKHDCEWCGLCFSNHPTKDGRTLLCDGTVIELELRKGAGS